MPNTDMSYDPRQVAYMKILCLLIHYLYSVLNCPIWKW